MGGVGGVHGRSGRAGMGGAGGVGGREGWERQEEWEGQEELRHMGMKSVCDSAPCFLLSIIQLSYISTYISQLHNLCWFHGLHHWLNTF